MKRTVLMTTLSLILVAPASQSFAGNSCENTFAGGSARVLPGHKSQTDAPLHFVEVHADGETEKKPFSSDFVDGRKSYSGKPFWWYQPAARLRIEDGLLSYVWNQAVSSEGPGEYGQFIVGGTSGSDRIVRSSSTVKLSSSGSLPSFRYDSWQYFPLLEGTGDIVTSLSRRSNGQIQIEMKNGRVFLKEFDGPSFTEVESKRSLHSEFAKANGLVFNPLGNGSQGLIGKKKVIKEVEPGKYAVIRAQTIAFVEDLVESDDPFFRRRLVKAASLNPLSRSFVKSSHVRSLEDIGPFQRNPTNERFIAYAIKRELIPEHSFRNLQGNRDTVAASEIGHLYLQTDQGNVYELRWGGLLRKVDPSERPH